VSFKLSERSLSKLEGVDSSLVAVVKRAIELTKVDFGVIYGMRTVEEQEKLVAAGKSQTMKSNHLVGKAVDLMAYVDGKGVWELNVYDDLCDAMKAAAEELGTPVKWGAAWSEGDIRTYPGTAEDAMMKYVDLRRSQGRRPFIDGPHFENM
tara:strand:- start:6 stop:458 length:453 start_codon:yes stop_codon:yes gene_type:complete